MQHRVFGPDKFSVSALGFGCMRLPTKDGLATGPVDLAESTRMIRHGIDAGINYLDTAKVYHEGKGEKAVGAALAGGYREKVQIATKLPLWGVETVSDCDKILREQLADLKTDVIDVYLFHCLQSHLWDAIKRLDLIRWAEKQRQAGKIRYIGFSFHDNLSLFKEIIDTYSWDMCMIQYNYANATHQAGVEGLKYAASKGISVVAMEPLFGGFLANPTGLMGKAFKNTSYDPVDLGLRWIWNQPEISLLISGMSTMSQVEQNLKIADRASVGGLTEEESRFIETLQKEYDQAVPIKCSKCHYCVPCPSGVDIPLFFDFYNFGKALPEKKEHYALTYSLFADDKRANACSECGSCESQCPQKLPIQKLLKEVHKFFT
ncbi:MAG: aldo/keto reductase [Planctomycetaceae bacterium]|nr:aldo/keto reductase [Planctomycetaceae bacterium]